MTVVFLTMLDGTKILLPPRLNREEWLFSRSTPRLELLKAIEEVPQWPVLPEPQTAS